MWIVNYSSIDMNKWAKGLGEEKWKEESLRKMKRDMAWIWNKIEIDKCQYVVLYVDQSHMHAHTQISS